MTLPQGSDTLPNFERPPVTEVALGVEFTPLPVHAIDLGSLWAGWRDEYPEVQEQPPLEPTRDEAQGPVPVISFGPPPMNRHWFISRDRAQLLQVQQDRLIVNWRRISDGDVYPRYPSLRNTFRQRLEELDLFARTYGGLRITRAEVTYINDLSYGADPGEEAHLASHLHDVVQLWGSVPTHHLGDPRQVRFAATFDIPDLADSGILHVGVDPTHRLQEGKVTSLLTLTVRGRPRGESPAEALTFLDEGRRHVVTSFTELTTQSMHERWGRR